MSLPVFQSSTFEYEGAGNYHDVRYIRLNNTPNHEALHAKMAALEGGEAALVAASGMAAISAALLAFLAAGSHVLAHRSLYGGTHTFLRTELPRMGVEATFVDADDPASWKSALRSTTRVLYVETMTNPLLEVVDLPAAAAFAREHDLVSIIDNTLATPVNFRPIEHGFDLVVHSATKYLNGHTDIVAGAVVGRAPHVERVKHLLDHLGGTLDPHACFLLQRGLKTLALRVRHQNESALAIARFLEKHPAVDKVMYPMLESHPGHARAREWFRGVAGLVSFEPKGGLEAADRFMKKVELPVNAPSLGGAETLMTRPALTSHVGLGPDERARQGIAEHLVRISVGLEGTEDLIADFAQALG